MHAGLALPFRFDPERLRADLALIPQHEWTPHYNRNDFGGDWRGVALRSSNGQITTLNASFTPASTFCDTPLMVRCSYFRQVVSAFLCPLKSVRLLSLAAGSFIREHTDNALVYEDGEMRIHIPVQTSAEVEFYVAGERLLFEEGSSYYVNVNLPHRITNRSSAERVHLIIDVEVNDWVHNLVRTARANHAAIPRTAPPARNFEEFAAAVLADPALRESLRCISGRQEFIETALRLGRQRGFDLLQPDVEAALPLTAFDAEPANHAPRPELGYSTLGWTPTRLLFRRQQPFLEWIYTGARRFTEPFFDDTLQECLNHPFTAAFRRESRLAALNETELAAHSLPPSGFIFHMSRCGSTLVSQMLASLPQTAVISEPEPLDQVLQAHLTVPGLSFEEQVSWLRRIILALGQRRTGSETHYLLSLDAWHIHRLPLLRAAFPGTPCLFLFRDPLQVMLSHAVTPGIHCLPGAMADPHALGLRYQDIIGLSREQWCAHVLMHICESALNYRGDPQMLFVDYRNLPDAVCGPIARHLSLPLGEPDLALMRERARFYAKNGVSPWLGYDEYSLEPARIAALQELCAELLAPKYAELNRAADSRA